MNKSLISNAVKFGYITAEQKIKAEKYKQETAQNDETVLRDMKLLSERDIYMLYSKMYRIPFETEFEAQDDNIALKIKSNDLHRLLFYPVRNGEVIKIYTSFPANLLYAEDIIREAVSYKGTFEYAVISSRLQLFSHLQNEDRKFLWALPFSI